jgi:hypothetical protein
MKRFTSTTTAKRTPDTTRFLDLTMIVAALIMALVGFASVNLKPAAASSEFTCVIYGANADGSRLLFVVPAGQCEKSVTVSNGRVTQTLSGPVPNLSSSAQAYELKDCWVDGVSGQGTATVSADNAYGRANDDIALGTWSCTVPLTLKPPAGNGCPQLCPDPKSLTKSPGFR